MNMLKPEEAQNSLGGGKCRRVSGSGAEGWGGGGELTKKMPSDQRQAKGSSNIQYNNPQSPSECGSGRWRTGMRSGKGRGEMENKGKELKQCICGRERERERDVERGCGRTRRTLYIMTGSGIDQSDCVL